MESDRLDLGKPSFSPQNKDRIRTALHQNKTLKRMRLPNSHWTDESAPALCTLLQNNHTLQLLLLSNAECSAQELINLCEVLTNNKALMALSLKRTSWTPESIAALCQLLQQNAQLKIVELREARFTPEHITSLCEALGQNQSLENLFLTNTTWSDASVETLCHYVSINTSLKTLMLREAKISPDMMTKLLASLSRNHKLRDVSFNKSTWGEGSLTSLHECITQNHTLESIPFTFSTFTDAGLIRLFGSLSKNNVLKNVNFHNCALTDVGADAISVFLLRNSQVEDMWFIYSQFTDTGVVDLMSSLSVNETIVYLNFASSVLSDAVIPDICRMLQDNKHIKQIVFYWSKFTDRGVSRLMKTLAKTNALQSLDIMQDDLTDEVIADLCSFLDQNTTIQTLRGDDLTDDKLRWALQELVKLDNVQEADIDGEIMELEVKQVGEWDAIRIRAADDWDKDPASSGLFRTLTGRPDQQNPDKEDFSTGDGDQNVEELSQKITKHGDVYTVPVDDQRWVKVQKHGNGSATKTHISAWCPQDVLTTCNHLHNQKETVTGCVEIDFNTSEDSWGSPQLESWTQEKWVPVLTSLLVSPGKVTGLCVKAHNLLPINGLLHAAQGILTPQHPLTGGMTVCGGQVSEDLLLKFLDGTHTVSLHVNLSDITVVLRQGRGLGDVQELAKLVQQKVVTDVQGSWGKVERLMYVTPAGEVVYEDVDSEEEHMGQRQKTRTIKVVVSEMPWELQVLEPKYRRAYEEASKKGTHTVCQSRVMVVGHYGAGKTNLVRCLLNKRFLEHHETTIGIEADPNDAKINITKSKGWEQHKEDTFQSKMAKHILNEAQKQDAPAAADAPVLPTEGENIQVTEPKDFNEDKLSSSARGPTRRSQRHHESSTAPSLRTKEEQSPKSTDKGIPLNIMEEIAKEEERRKQKMIKQSEASQELFFWDYAGQGVFYTTHQLFLTARAMYVVVMNMKKKLTDKIFTYRENLNGETVLDHSCPQTVQDYLQYWLCCVYTHVDSARRAAGMEATRWDPQVIIALTHKDECSEEEIKEYKADLDKFLEDKGYKFLIQDVLTISNRNREYNDVKNMKEALEKLGKERNYTVPLSWYKLKEGIMKEDKKSLTMDDIRSIANKEDLQDFDETTIQAALSFFHEVGDVVYFKEGPLSDFIVKDVQWLVDEFKKVISITADHKNQPGYAENVEHWTSLNDCGILHQKLLESIWPEENTRTKLLSLMLRFCLVMPAPNFYTEKKEDTHYLVPCLLPARDPTTEPQTDHVIRLCPNLGFLPVGLISRLLASLTVESKWRSVGRVYQDQGTFHPGQDRLGIITIRKRSADNKQSTHIEAIEVLVHKESKSMGDRKLKDTFSVIVQALHNLPGKNDFGVWLCCKTCQQWNFICNLQQADDQSICERSICEKHGPILKQSEHARWFCENIENEAQALKSEAVPSKNFGSMDQGNEEPAEIAWEDKKSDDGARFLQLTSLLVFINRANEELLEQMGLDGLEVLKLIVKKINTYPRWKIQGFLRAFPLGIQNLIKDHLGMYPLYSDDSFPVQQPTSPHKHSPEHGRKQVKMDQRLVISHADDDYDDEDVTQEEDNASPDQDVGDRTAEEIVKKYIRQEEEKEKEEQDARQCKEKERKDQNVRHEKENLVVEQDVRHIEGNEKEDHNIKDKEEKEREEQDIREEEEEARKVQITQHEEKQERGEQVIQQEDENEGQKQNTRNVREKEKEEREARQYEEDKRKEQDVRQAEQHIGGNEKKDSNQKGIHSHNVETHKQAKDEENGARQHEGSSIGHNTPATRPDNTFSRRFFEEGGVLQNPNSDVTVTVPSNAVLPGETVTVSASIYTNLQDYDGWVQADKEDILGPVVECTTDRKKDFLRHVIISIPLYLMPKKKSDIKVLYSLGKVFKDITHDDDLEYEIKDSFINISTHHFTTFVVKGKKKMEVSDVLLSVVAGFKSSTMVEFRLLAHVNCLRLKDFEQQRSRCYPADMEEIDLQPICLPEKGKMNFPVIIATMRIEEDCSWRIMQDEPNGMITHVTMIKEEVDGQNVLVHGTNHGTKPIKNFFLANVQDFDKLSLSLEVTFDYPTRKDKPVIAPIKHKFRLTYPKQVDSSDAVSDSGASASGGASAAHPARSGLAADSCVFVTPSASFTQEQKQGQTVSRDAAADERMLPTIAEAIRREVQQNRARLVGETGLGVLARRVHFIESIKALRIIHETDIQEIEAVTTPAGKAACLIKYLLPCSLGSLIMFAWLLVQEKQAHQLPDSITREVKTVLRGYNQRDIMRLADDL